MLYSLKVLKFKSSKIILEFNRDIQPGFKTSDLIRKNLKELDLIFLRQDPPFDMSYITSTFLLEYIEDEVKIINKPSEVRNAPEKLFLNRWRDLTPETIITKNISEINSFRKKHKKIILKPLYGNGGNGIFFLDEKDKNFDGFTVNSNLVNLADKDAIILHCLPAYRSKEITDEVIESRKSRIFEQAENRMHAQQALLACMLS